MHRYTALRELIPSKDKADKATVLMQVVEYIRQIQVAQHSASIPLPLQPHMPCHRPHSLAYTAYRRRLHARQGVQHHTASAAPSHMMCRADCDTASAGPRPQWPAA